MPTLQETMNELTQTNRKMRHMAFITSVVYLVLIGGTIPAVASAFFQLSLEHALYLLSFCWGLNVGWFVFFRKHFMEEWLRVLSWPWRAVSGTCWRLWYAKERQKIYAERFCPELDMPASAMDYLNTNEVNDVISNDLVARRNRTYETLDGNLDWVNPMPPNPVKRIGVKPFDVDSYPNWLLGYKH
jgi:hypothetical protein